MRKIILLTGLTYLVSCYPKHKYEDGYFPENPINFQEVNSEFDDMNSSAPWIEDDMFFHFSSNRNTKGGTFDIVGNGNKFFWDKDKGKFSLSKVNIEIFNYFDTLSNLINTAQNEFGPFSFQSGTQEIIFYSSDISGNSDIMFAYHQFISPNTNNISGPFTLKLANTSFDELYPTFYGDNLFYGNTVYVTSNIKELYFCANYDGNFDIYRIKYWAEADFIYSLINANYVKPDKISVLSSGSEDKCPFINGNLLVFTSNRPGGYGGYDLYYSNRTGDNWSEPKNFGDKINTEFDEYRPITITLFEYSNNLMFFSSNRPGGKGGYDLYYVGINQKIK